MEVVSKVTVEGVTEAEVVAMEDVVVEDTTEVAVENVMNGEMEVTMEEIT